MSIADKLIYLNGTKEAIKEAIREKGVTVDDTDTFRSYAEKIGEIQTGGGSGWVRNPDWLPLPEITAADNRFVGLFVVFENEYNQLSVQATNNSANINWGDGTSVVSNGAVQTKVYDYASIISPVSQYYDGRNYKQVIVDITRQNTLLTLSVDRNSGLNNTGNINFVDIVFSLPECTTVNLNSARRLRICERVVILNIITTTLQSAFQSMSMLQYLDTPLNQITQDVGVSTMFLRTGLNLKYFNNEEFDIVSPTITSMFNGAWIRRVGDITCNSGLASTTSNVFQSSTIERVGDINLPNATNLTNFFYAVFNLQSIGVINAPNVQVISSMFTLCNSLPEIVFTDCSNITTITTGSQGTFYLCYSLKKLVMPGMRIGCDVSTCNLDAQALLELANSVGTASGSQTWITAGNPGAADPAYIAVFNSKGYTVTT
jgi:hypothetical protein